MSSAADSSIEFWLFTKQYSIVCVFVVLCRVRCNTLTYPYPAVLAASYKYRYRRVAISEAAQRVIQLHQVNESLAADRTKFVYSS